MADEGYLDRDFIGVSGNSQVDFAFNVLSKFGSEFFFVETFHIYFPSREVVAIIMGLSKEFDIDWKAMIGFCNHESFHDNPPDMIYTLFTTFLKNVDLCSKYFNNNNLDKSAAIISTVKLNLQKTRDDFKKYVPLLLKLFSQETFVSDTNKTFTLSKDDFSYYYAIDFAVRRILKCVETCDSVEGRSRTAILILILWSEFPEFGPIFLAQLFKICPYALPYIPPDGKTSGLAQKERHFSVFLHFQAVLMSTENTFNLYDYKFAWLWFDNACKQMQNSEYANQSFCFVFLEFCRTIQQNLIIRDAKRFSEMLKSLQEDILPKLKAADQSKDILNDYITKYFARNMFF